MKFYLFIYSFTYINKPFVEMQLGEMQHFNNTPLGKMQFGEMQLSQNFESSVFLNCSFLNVAYFLYMACFFNN